MSQCTAPVYGHRTSSAAARCPACSSRSYRSSYSYRPPSTPYRAPTSGGSSYSGSSGSARTRRTRRGTTVVYSASEWLAFQPFAREAVKQAKQHPDRRDLFLCHAWDDREGAATEMYDCLRQNDASVWFSERDVGLGELLHRTIDKGLKNSRVGIVLVTPAMLRAIDAGTIAEQELSALLASGRVIPVAHGTTFEALRKVSPMLASHAGLSTADSSLATVAAKVAAAAAALDDDGLAMSS